MGATIFTDLNSTTSEPTLGSNVPVTGPQSVGAAFTPVVNSTRIQAPLKVLGSPRDPTLNLFLHSDVSGAPGLGVRTLGTDLMAPAFPARSASYR